MTTHTEVRDQTTTREVPDRPSDRRNVWRARLKFSNVGVIYVLLALIVVFSFWAPETFPTWTTAKAILNQNAIAGLMALALVAPLSARVFDLSIGHAMGLSNAVVAWLLVSQGWPVLNAIVVTLVMGVALGLLNAMVVVGARLDSFIGTLATGSLFAAGVSLVTHDQTIAGPELAGSFGNITTTNIAGIQLPVILMILVAILVWVVQRYTMTGRRLYAIGFNERASGLVGIRTKKLMFMSLVFTGLVAGLAGVLLASAVSAGTPNIGPPYLLNAYAAAFLGATQFGNRFNAWGTVVAVLLLGTGTTGLILVGGPTWTQSAFSGAVLLLALGAASFEKSGSRNIVRRRSASKSSAQDPQPADG